MSEPCGATFDNCLCSRSGPHDVHACTNPSEITSDHRCHGQWRDDGTIVQFPTGARTEDEARSHALLLLAGVLPIEVSSD